MTKNIKYFKASWCGNCRTFEPIFDKLMENYPDVAVAKIDVDAASDDTLAAYNITDLPHIAYEDTSKSTYIVHLKPNKDTIDEFLRSQQ